MPPKSIYRRPGAKHFQLVHRSQRDPLANDPDASPHVLRPFERDNVARKGRSLAELEAELAEESQSSSKVRDNLGEAVLYGVDYDDSEYDYMQHLREFGVKEDGVESILIEAPAVSTKKKTASKQPIRLKDEELIPREALASTYEIERDYERDADAGEAIPAELRGLQPDMNPHLRQTLEALDDDAFIATDIDEDDFFAELVDGGEADEDEEPEFPFVDEGLDSDHSPEANGDDEEDESFEARFKRFKQAQGAAAHDSDDGSDVETERADTISGLPKLPVVGGKRRRKGASDASGYSLSSSSMFRNQGLTDLDERYDQIERQYEDDDDDEDDDGSDLDSDGDEAPDLMAAREDFNSLVDDFLENYEQVGNKMRPVMPGEAPLDKLDTLRRAFDAPTAPSSQPPRRKTRPIVDPADIVVEEDKDRWDCETILTTYTNIENHPRLIRARAEKPVPKIKLDPKTGLPTVVDTASKPTPAKGTVDSDSDSDSDSGIDMGPKRETITRQRDETPEEKKARKQAIKQERQSRRAEKKATKEAFANESRKQVKKFVTQDPGKTRKL